MAEEWSKVSLQEANVELIDCDHRTPPASDAGYPYVAIPQLRNGHVQLSEVRRITREDYIEWTRKAKPSPNDVILSRRCNPGETAWVPPGLEFALGQNLVLLRADGTRVFPPFLRWLVRGPEWWDQIGKFLNVGAVFDSLKCADVPKFELCIPPLRDQRAIAHILGALDDKIELNRRTNQTLEATARALFKSWFIDFDPVRAKAEGRQPSGMDAATAALFPRAFTDSELGKIPRNWSVRPLGDLAQNPRRGVDPSSLAPGTSYVGLEHMPRKSIALGEWGESDSVASNKFRFAPGEILFGKLRPYFHKVGVAPVDGVCSTDILVVTPKESHWFAFVLGHASSEDLVQHADATSTGTKMPRTNWQDLARFQVVAPSDAVAGAFDNRVRPMMEAIRATIHESRTLAAARDALLPKLLSGEVRVKDAEQFVEAKT